MKQRSVGLLIAFVGTLVVTPDAALLRVQAEAGASPAVITVWRYAMSFFLGTAAAIIAHGGVSPVIESIRPAPLHVVGASCIMLGTNVGFTISLLKVDAAKALLLISLNPLWSALLGYFILDDKLPVRTVVAQVVALVAMLVMFAPNVLALLSPRSESARAAEAEVQSAADQGNSELFDLIPLVTGMAQAALLIFVRSASIRIPECTMDFVPALSALFTVAFAVAKIAFLDGNADGSPWSLSSLVTGLHPHFWLALLGCGLGVAGYNLACTVAPRYLTGAQAVLLEPGARPPPPDPPPSIEPDPYPWQARRSRWCCSSRASAGRSGSSSASATCPRRGPSRAALCSSARSSGTRSPPCTRRTRRSTTGTRRARRARRTSSRAPASARCRARRRARPSGRAARRYLSSAPALAAPSAPWSESAR